MGRFNDFNADERELLLRLLINYLDTAPPGDKRRELGRSLLNELPSTLRHVRMFGSELKKARKRAGYRSAEQFAKKLEITSHISQVRAGGNTSQLRDIGTHLRRVTLHP